MPRPAQKSPVPYVAKISAVVGVVLLLWFGRIGWDYFDPDSPANASEQIQLKMFGAAIYEYHSETGRWPTKLDDLAQTSLPAKSYLWRQTARPMVLLWPQSLRPDPRDNAGTLLAYWNGGLYAGFGRVWACWGDLRTERLNRSALGRKK